MAESKTTIPPAMCATEILERAKEKALLENATWDDIENALSYLEKFYADLEEHHVKI